MSIWVLTDDAGRIVALNPNCMDGNSGWVKMDAETLGIGMEDNLFDSHGAALYALQDGVAILRPEADRQGEWPGEIEETGDAITSRLDAAESTLATHDTEIEQIVTGLEALANGG